MERVSKGLLRHLGIKKVYSSSKRFWRRLCTLGLTERLIGHIAQGQFEHMINVDYQLLPSAVYYINHTQLSP